MVGGYLLDNVAFIFQYGERSSILEVADTIEKYGSKALFLLETDEIGSDGCLSSGDVTELSGRGHTIGIHLNSQKRDFNNTVKKFTEAQQVFARILGLKPTVAAVSGYCGNDLVKALADAGIRDVYTSTPTTKTRREGLCKVMGSYSVSVADSPQRLLSIVTDKKVRRKISLRHKMLTVANIIINPLRHIQKQ